MAQQGRRPEPVAKLSDHLVIVAPCSRCKRQMRVPFSRVAQSQRLACDSCNLSWEFDFDNAVLSTLDQSFRRLEDPIRDREAWVEVHPHP